MLTLYSFTRISEDSSEIVFLLVENYQLTAGLGFFIEIGTEFFDQTKQTFATKLFIDIPAFAGC
jgi:hypothetical protein